LSGAVDVSRCRWHGADGTEHAARIVAFLEKIGIAVHCEAQPGAEFLPGIALRGGAIHINPDVEIWPGDLLHEAGHIAVTESHERPTLSQPPDDLGMEMATMAWSVAALAACGLPLEVVFHEASHRGQAQMVIDRYRSGQFVGAPMLAWFGMTAEPHRAEETGLPAYPAMQRWLR
jgi:hypothetical protein